MMIYTEANLRLYKSAYSESLLALIAVDLGSILAIMVRAALFRCMDAVSVEAKGITTIDPGKLAEHWAEVMRWRW